MAQINFRMDDELKRDMEQVCDQLGINITTAFTIFAKKVTREQRIPFDLVLDPFYSESNQNKLRKAIEQLEAGAGKSNELIEVEDK